MPLAEPSPSVVDAEPLERREGVHPRAGHCVAGSRQLRPGADDRLLEGAGRQRRRLGEHSAAIADTCGVAIEVPSEPVIRVAVIVEQISSPGARTSTDCRRSSRTRHGVVVGVEGHADEVGRRGVAREHGPGVVVVVRVAGRDDVERVRMARHDRVEEVSELRGVLRRSVIGDRSERGVDHPRAAVPRRTSNASRMSGGSRCVSSGREAGRTFASWASPATPIRRCSALRRDDPGSRGCRGHRCPRASSLHVVDAVGAQVGVQVGMIHVRPVSTTATVCPTPVLSAQASMPSRSASSAAVLTGVRERPLIGHCSSGAGRRRAKVGLGIAQRTSGSRVQVAQRVARVAGAPRSRPRCRQTGSARRSGRRRRRGCRLARRRSGPASRCTMIRVEVSAAAACGSRTRRTRASGSVRISTEVFSATGIVNLNGGVRE